MQQAFCNGREEIFTPRTLSPGKPAILAAAIGHLFLVASIVTVAALPGFVQAADAAPGTPASFAARKTYDIPAGSLEVALNRFGREAGILLSFPTELTNGLATKGLQGSYNVQEALPLLLHGTDLVATIDGASAFVHRQSSAVSEATLPMVQVTSTVPSVTEGSGSYASGPGSMSTGLNLSSRETPQTVTVITRQQMDDQGSTSVSDVMRQSPGITVLNYDSERWSFNARGFSVTNFQSDGVSRAYDGVYDWGTTNSDMTIYDRVEMVKGATGLMSGAGDPSATINLVRKRPTKEFAGALTASLGSWNNGRTEVDLSGPLNESGSMRGRVVGAYQDKESFLEHYRQKKSVLYGVLEADLTRDTMLTVGMDYQKLDPRGSTWTGFPIFYSDGTRTNFDRSFNPATTWSRREMETTNLFATLDHRLSNDWQLKLTANSQSSKHRSLLGSASGGNPDPVTGTGMYLFTGDFIGDRTQNTVNASLSGSFELGGRKHEAMLGAMWSDAKTDGPWSNSLYPMMPGSIFDWNGVYPQSAFPVIASYDEQRRQMGAYAATRLRPTDELSVILGARVSWVDGTSNRVYYDGVTPTESSSMNEKNVITPYAGVVYDLDDTYSVYGSYTSIFQPQEYRDINRQFLPSVEGRSYEVGIKGSYLDGRVNASVALFQIEQDNVAENAGFVGGETVYRTVKGVNSKGIEAEVSGQLAAGWNLQAGYAYTDVQDAKGERVYGSTLMASQPEHVVRLTSNYKLPGEWNKLTVGGGVSWQSAIFGKVWNPVAADYAVIEQKNYAFVNLMARYQFDKNLSVLLNINNVFDKKYLSGVGLFETGFYGEPRNAMLTMKYQF